MADKHTFDDWIKRLCANQDNDWNKELDGLDEIDKMAVAYRKGRADQLAHAKNELIRQGLEEARRGEFAADPPDIEADLDWAEGEDFTESEMKAIFRLASYAAKYCGGGEDLIGAIMYTGAFHFLKNQDEAVVTLVEKIEKHYDPRFDPPQPK